MKKLIPLLAILASLALPAIAEEKIEAGPRGGRLLTLEGQKAEFLVESDRTVTIAFYDDALKPAAPSGQVVTATAEAPTGKTKLEFAPKDGLLASTAPLPEGDGYTVVVQIRADAEARPKNFRIHLDTAICGGCNRAEYACTCEHH